MKGQVTVQFNWIYVMVAGAAILLFFIMIITQQKEMSEKRLNYKVMNILENIFTGSTVAENTKNFLDTSGVRNEVFQFRCELDESGGIYDVFSYYGISGSSASIESPLSVVVAPLNIKTNKMILWSMPYKLPFKVMDFLFVTSKNTKYYVVSDGSSDFYIELLNSTNGLNVEFIDNVGEVEYNGEYHVRLILLESGTPFIEHEEAVPLELSVLNNDQVSAVRFHDGAVLYYVKRGNAWYVEGGNEGEWTPLVSTGSERDAVAYAALFAGNAETFRCNMMKAFKRLSLVSQVLQDKVELMIGAYESREEYAGCLSILKDDSTMYRTLSLAAQQCTTNYLACGQITLRDQATKIYGLNQELSAAGCTRVY